MQQESVLKNLWEKTVQVISIHESLEQINNHWQPLIIGELNNQHIKVAKLKGEFVMHHHDDEDEMFLVVHGELQMVFEDDVKTVNEGEFIIIPRGVNHKPVATEEVHIVLFEPATTLNTGNVINERTVHNPKRAK